MITNKFYRHIINYHLKKIVFSKLELIFSLNNYKPF